MSDNPTPPPRHVFRWVLMALFVMALPAAIIVGVLKGYQHILRPTIDTPSTRRLHEIGQALHRYAQDHGGRYPGSLAALASDQGLPADLPTVPTSAAGGPFEYLYLGGPLSEQTTTNGTVLAYEPTAANGGRGSHVLYADGTDTWVAAADLEAELHRGQAPGPPPE